MEELVITNKGRELIAKLIEGSETINFTKIKTSVHDYSKDDLENLTELDEIKQESLVSSIEKTDSSVVEVIAMINNDGLNKGYYIKTIGLYAKDSKDNEILYGVSIAGEYPDYMPAFGGKTVSSISYKLITKVDNAEQVNIEINPGAIPTITQINELKQIVVEFKENLDEHTNINITSDNGSHGLKFDENESKLKYKKDGEWKDIPTGEQAETEINTHKLKSILSNDGVHDLRYAKDDKKFQYYENDKWNEIDGVGSVLKITFDEAFKGAVYKVTGADDTKEGIVSDGLLEIVYIKNCNTTYTIKATADNTEYTSTIRTDAYFGEYSASLDVFKATIKVTTVANANVVAMLDSNTYSSQADTSGIANIVVGKAGNYSVKSILDNVESNVVNVNVTEEGKVYEVVNKFITLTLTSPIGCEITVVNGATNLSKTSTGQDVFYLPNTGTWDVNISKDNETANGSVNVTDYVNYNLDLSFVKIYGVVWDGTPGTKWSRTNDSAEFVDPNPYVAGSSNYGSPFDNLMPWAGMVKEERSAGTMVAIPKFWYKLTQKGKGMELLIADKPVEGFWVSPAHMDRGDGKGERDVVYHARYHCGENDYRSVTGVKPKVNITRDQARKAIHNLGSTIWQKDFILSFTLQLLYLVEFADWNSQKTIGLGCGNGTSVQNMGYTDSMPYHTGTIASSRDVYGLGTQYRNIEGLWDNVSNWCDGCYNASRGLNIIVNPNDFKDITGGTTIGVLSTGWPSEFGVSDTAGFTMFYPTDNKGSSSTYSCDIWYFNTSYPCVSIGGTYNQDDSYGLFCFGHSGVSYYQSNVGCRLQELP